jgi:hypothetical protein
MRGRERAVTDRWIAQLVELTDKLNDVGLTVGKPALEGGGVTSTVEPRKTPLVESGDDSDSASDVSEVSED